MTTFAYRQPSARIRAISPRSKSGTGGALLVGAVAGLVGTVAMSSLEAVWTRYAPEALDPQGGGERLRRLKNAGWGGWFHAQGEPRSHHWHRSPSERAVEAIGRSVGHKPSPREREVLGSAFHYGFGAAGGAAYGALAKRFPWLTASRGLLYGTLVWLLADELGMPAAGIADWPHQTPVRRHAYSLAAHFAYGLGLEQTRRVLSQR